MCNFFNRIFVYISERDRTMVLTAPKAWSMRILNIFEKTFEPKYSYIYSLAASGDDVVVERAVSKTDYDPKISVEENR